MRIPELVKGIQSPTELFLNAVNEQAMFTENLPYVLTLTPLVQMNPFQRLLYCSASQSGYAIVPAVNFQNLADVNWNLHSIIHLHWVSTVLSDCTRSVEAKERINAFEKEMIRWRKAGHRIVWTLHNVLPHDVRHMFEHEVALRKIIVKHCDIIHILSEGSAYEARQYYELPEEKIFFVPHPSYEGWYANVGARTTARLELGLAPESFAFVQFGSLQPYKGVLELIQAFKSLKSRYHEQSLCLVIVGIPSDKAYVDQVLEASIDSCDIHVLPIGIQEKEIQTIFNAADVVVAPYLKTLNSGVALLAATFRKPLVAPRAAGVMQTFSEDTTLLYDVNDVNGLPDALERSLSYEMSEHVFDNILNKFNPATVSESFFNGLTQRLFQD